MKTFRFKKEYKQFMLGILLIVGLSFGFMGLWAIDIGVSSMGANIEVTNGWFSRAGIQQYHIGLWLCYASLMILSGISLFSLIYMRE